jgi:ATP-dependent 26S proteasome regulatory subunit
LKHKKRKKKEKEKKRKKNMKKKNMKKEKEKKKKRKKEKKKKRKERKRRKTKRIVGSFRTSAKYAKRFFDNFAKNRAFDPLIAANWYNIIKQDITAAQVNSLSFFSLLVSESPFIEFMQVINYLKCYFYLFFLCMYAGMQHKNSK